MAFDKPTRNRLASFVGQARDLIAEEFTQQFQSLYGISEKGSITPVDQLVHLDDTGLAISALLRERIDYLIKTNPNDRDGLKAAVARLAREQAFTVLNRLAAIRMAEKRGIIVESVGNGYQSKGFKVFEQVAGVGLGDTYRRYCRYLYCLFDELAVDLGILFDRRSPQGLLFPREPALQALLALLNVPDLDPLWADDETIGWIYQYYNDPAERKKMRDESAAPRNSRELAVRNQFFTPRYVVEFLTDNTLGRIWYEMTQGETRLKESCHYLVRRPTEIFLKPVETTPKNSTPEGLNQEEIFKQPVYIPYRSLKDPRELRMLDPACGSMHFGLYAFDLYEVIYEEAWDMGMESLHCDFPDKDTFIREVPRLIIEHNIHGIDIDPRAVQIAGLALWLRAQKSWQALCVPPAQRPRIMRSNIVCAEPMPGSLEFLKEFAATLQPPLLGQLVEKVFAQMQLAGEAGSLLRIEEEIATLVKEAKKHWQASPRAKQVELSLGLEAKLKQGEFPLDVSGISDERFWETAEESIYTALHVYSEEAESDSYQRRLFAEDAARGFAFIDLCRKRYDAVLTNPPFGEPSSASKAYLKSSFPFSKHDAYAAFIEEALNRCSCNGFVGAITARTGFFLTTFTDWRCKILLPATQVEAFIDLGYGVLDGAMVETATYVLSKRPPIQGHMTPFIRCLAEEDKNILSVAPSKLIRSKNLFMKTVSDFSLLPSAQFAYWVDGAVIGLFSKFVPIEPTHALIKQGIATGDNERFLRLHCEVDDKNRRTNWRSYAKGGDYAKFYSDLDLVVKWFNDGEEIKTRAAAEYGSASRTIKNTETFGSAGITYTLVTTSGFSSRCLPAESIYDMTGPAIFPVSPDPHKRWFILGVLNTKAIQSLLSLITDSRHWHVISLQHTPIPVISDTSESVIAAAAREACYLRMNLYCSDECSPLFHIGSLSGTKSLSERFSDTTLIRKWSAMSAALESSIELEMRRAFGVDLSIVHAETQFFDSDMPRLIELYTAGAISGKPESVISYLVGSCVGRWDIRFATGECRPPELPDPFAPLPACPPGTLQNVIGLTAGPKDIPANYPLRISWPGILVDDENHPEDIVARIREAFEVIWKDCADAIEQEAYELLGVKSLRDYFRRPTGFLLSPAKKETKITG